MGEGAGTLRRGARAGLVVAGFAVALRLVEAGGRLDHVALAGPADAVSSLQRWLPWQLWDNLAAGRSPFDDSVFLEGAGSLLRDVGNPGLAVFVAPFFALGSPTAGAALGVLLVLTLNVFGGAFYGATRGVPWLGALAGAAAWWVTGAAAGHGAQVCVGPAAMAAAAWASDRRALGGALGLLAAFVAPLPSAAFFVGAGVFPLAALAALGLVAAPLGTWGASGVSPVDLVWPAGRASRALPLGLPVAILGAWAARGAPRVAAVVVILGLLLGITPNEVQGFQVRPVWAPGSGAALSAAVALAFSAGLPLAAQLVSHRRFALGVLLAADSAGPLLLGGGAAWAEEPTIPEVYRSLWPTPRAGLVFVVPGLAAVDGGVGWVPMHRQRLARAPAVPGPPWAERRPPAPSSLDYLARLVNEAEAPLVIVLVGADAAAASVYASRLGPPDELVGGEAIWRWP